VKSLMHAKHTSGPWKVVGRDIETADGYTLASVVEQDAYEDHDANARLIAAAPELLVALHDAWVALPDARGGTELNARLKSLLQRLEVI